MNQFEVIFYEKENGESPLYNFIEELSPKKVSKRFLRKDGCIMKNLQQFKEEQLQNPEVAKAYEEIQPEMDVIRAIVNARTLRNLTQKELAERTGINQADISKLENGTRNPSINLLKRLAEGMDMMLKIEFIPKHKI